jgi:hypothetical protein
MEKQRHLLVRAGVVLVLGSVALVAPPNARAAAVSSPFDLFCSDTTECPVLGDCTDPDNSLLCNPDTQDYWCYYYAGGARSQDDCQVYTVCFGTNVGWHCT